MGIQQQKLGFNNKNWDLTIKNCDFTTNHGGFKPSKMLISPSKGWDFTNHGGFN
jgi:hypothetical protein